MVATLPPLYIEHTINSENNYLIFWNSQYFIFNDCRGQNSQFMLIVIVISSNCAYWHSCSDYKKLRV
jgi:hypothetical protein